MTGQVFFYILITSVLLVFSVVLDIKPVNIISYVFTLTYLLGSLEGVMLMLPVFMRAGVASGNLEQLKKEMEASLRPVTRVVKNIDPDFQFEKIQVYDLEFYYDGTGQSFGIGPVSLQINKGEVVFIYGGNGSGKTTFVYTLMGLYYPTAGHLMLNETPVEESGYPLYRSMFAVVFSDYYLFNEIIIPAPLDERKAEEYLRVFELSDKVTITDNRFSTVNLSAGQKKRLAIIAALLEGKRVLVLDEWAADQDPHFRSKFYTEIIPWLKINGITILAITHDDKYYYCADKLFKMEEGRLVQKNITVPPNILLANEIT
jgi:cyclic peptide transporter